jgi:hypothetical protein|nr:MAG TPA: hypothetical protein [Caudoviricetes sp.]
MKLSSILIGVAGVAVGAGALYAYNRFIGGAASADDCADECEDDDVVDEEPATEE